MLYLRMFVIMAVGLYTSSAVVKYLGVDDFGIYNIIGGVVIMFSIISSSLSAAIGRFLTFELGRGNTEKLRRIFSTAILIQVCMGLVVVLVGELIGPWFINTQMDIPSDRLGAANWVLQCSLATFMINMISVPYNASIIAHEKMQSFAYISLLEAALKLAVVFALSFHLFDSLKTYAVLIMLTALLIRWIYTLYCKRHFEECHFTFTFDKGLLKSMLSFSGWNFIGSSSAILRDQGVNILLNIFFGVALNAARGIATQVNTYILNFSNNFMIAVNPQIIKSYSRGEMEYMMQLLRQSARMSYFLLFFLSLPLIIETPFVLNVWLPVVPDHTVAFVRLVLIFSMSESISLPLQFAAKATGRIKYYQLRVGLLQLLNLPISYLLLYFGFAPESVFVIAIVISQLCFASSLYVLNRIANLDVKLFLKKVYLNIIVVTILASLIPFLYYEFIGFKETWINFFIVCSICVVSAGVSILYVGCNHAERTKIYNMITSKFKRS